MRRPLEIRLPPARRWPWIAIAASVVVHSLLLFGWIEGRPPILPRRPSQLIVLAPPGRGAGRGHRCPIGCRARRGAPARASAGDAADPAERSGRVRRRWPSCREPAADAGPRPDTGGTPPPAAASRPAIGRDRSRPGGGQALGAPAAAPARELAQRLSKSHAELVDSAVTAIVQGYLDSIANDPAPRDAGLPSWTKEIAGKKFGIDSKNIYIAGLKIPAAVLALLPIPAGNIDQNRAYNHLMDLRPTCSTRRSGPRISRSSRR